jgi:hypothetical protein
MTNLCVLWQHILKNSRVHFWECVPLLKASGQANLYDATRRTIE